ncbi:Six-hairpin glycosidase-like protein [Radiomyces spectabilis]|uniref:Six-hairpin glycosidase-like protein n=1 Tax=Radiomyces spectabilis TaxID=64574 RepID=UPI00221EEE0D|nr:Six-hairpin glycosidase-like protein [Radiomyces spectabilis]KAI8365377.1 Six-hairpin glycosidase-like protein [Radiomyces spectabilis]
MVEATYSTWRQKYLRAYQDGFYVYYKEPSENLPEMTCSEAHGYGMLISVLKRNQMDFDGLYRYFMRFRNRKGLMQWQQKSTRSGEFVPGDEGGENCATDGDVDIATALFLAARVWGRGGPNGEIDYKAAAIALAASIWEHCIHHETYMPLIGDWADPGDDAFLLTRPSDFILSGYLIFYQDDVERQQLWANVISAIVNTTSGQLQMNPQTGLIADFLKLDPQSRLYYPARGEVLESEHDGDYNWNSCRVPWRLGHYYMLTRDERLRPILETQAHFFAAQLARGGGGGGDCGVKAGYNLHGHCYVDYTDMAFVAPVSFLFWVLGWTTQLQQILQDMNQMQENTYFGETIAMLCLLEANVPF